MQVDLKSEVLMLKFNGSKIPILLVFSSLFVFQGCKNAATSRKTASSDANSISESELRASAYGALIFSATPAATTIKKVDSISYAPKSSNTTVKKIECSLDSSAYATCVSPSALMVAIGSHTFKARGLNNNGKVLSTISYTWKVVADTSTTTPVVNVPVVTPPAVLPPVVLPPVVTIPSPTPVVLPPVASVPTGSNGWIPCSVEGEACIFSGSRRVMYGLTPTDTTIIKTFSNKIDCSDTTFGGNPDPNGWSKKFCWYEGTVAPIVPSMAMTGPTVDYTKIPTANPGTGLELIGPQVETLTPDSIGAFREPCLFSHFAYDDPIVFPGQPGKSHLHAFFGNTGANAFSTVDSIANTGTSTCSGGTLNRTAYWVPALIDTTNGSVVRPASIMTYYKTGYYGIKPADIHAVPTGLRMITGNAKNAAADTTTAEYSCVSSTNAGLWQNSIPNCAVGDEMLMVVEFPQCWDGVNLDSADHKSHMSGTVNGACPKDHPVAIPVISFNVHYKIEKANAGRGWRLSSDNYDASLPGGYSGHGDYFFGWKPEIVKSFTESCLNKSLDCHAEELGNGKRLGGI